MDSLKSTDKSDKSNMVVTLNRDEWTRLSRNARPKTTVHIESCAAKPSEYDEYLKRESRELSKHWTDTVEKNRERKLRGHKLKEQQKKAEGT